MRIVFSGGGTLGPVTPLLEIYRIAKDAYPDATFLWLGTEAGPERVLIESLGIGFKTIPTAKFRRYISFKNFTDIFRFIYAIYKSLKILIENKADLCISAGAFVSVPVHFSAWIINVPTWVHQQDLQPGLANRLMAPSAKVVSTALEQSKFYFKKNDIKWIGNPVRESLLNQEKENGYNFFKLKKDLPVVLALGGGTGSMRVNQMIVEAVDKLNGVCQIIHLSGSNRPQEQVKRAQEMYGNYYQVYEFLAEEMGLAYAVSDLVIARGGFGTISELAVLSKPTILIPKPGHQVANARYLGQKRASKIVDETTASGYDLAKVIKNTLENRESMIKMGETLQTLVPRASKASIERILELLIG
jgi:UDP-N-acetylglucosamine--N-acetylmuramyl-(pentapeptide) pyrophosphoryl-undecaprenol N-acetylglucosamine transferase